MSEASPERVMLFVAYTATEYLASVKHPNFDYRVACSLIPLPSQIADRDILDSIDREMSGDLRDGYKAIGECMIPLSLSLSLSHTHIHTHARTHAHAKELEAEWAGEATAKPAQDAAG